MTSTKASGTLGEETKPQEKKAKQSSRVKETSRKKGINEQFMKSSCS
jgi:hypothetical protein